MAVLKVVDFLVNDRISTEKVKGSVHGTESHAKVFI